MEIDPSILLRLKNADQTHLVAYWDQLDHEQRAILIRDIINTDFDHVNQAFDDIKDQLTEQTTANEQANHQSIDDLMEPVPEHLSGSVDQTGKEQLEIYRRLGLKAIAEGSVGVLLLAGGQGTRLGRTNCRLSPADLLDAYCSRCGLSERNVRRWFAVEKVSLSTASRTHSSTGAAGQRRIQHNKCDHSMVRQMFVTH